MNILIVDDDRFVVSALEKKINWASLQIEKVFCAYNVNQSKKIMSDTTIDICVCDIEMPGESGLDLLAWVREQEFHTQFIFLTSYADFEYAQKAISLSSLDYQLKPVDYQKLYEILQKAVEKVHQTTAFDKTKLNSLHWNNNYSNIVDLFWENLFTTSITHYPDVLEKEFQRKALPYKISDSFLLILFKLYPREDLLKTLDTSIINFSFTNIAKETLLEHCILFETLITIQPSEYIMLIRNIKLDEVQETLFSVFEKLFANLRNFFKCDISCCIAKESPIHILPVTLLKLRSLRDENLSHINVPLILGDYIPKKAVYMPPSLNILNTFLEQKSADTAIENLERYLQDSNEKGEISKEFLLKLRLDVEQLVFSYLQKNGIEAHTLLSSTEEAHMLLSNALESVTYMMNYLKYIITRAVDYSNFITEEHSVIDIILNYIHQHYFEDITRSMLANLVYLNPDYMARLFKKQTNTSIINYITAYRIEKAKEFLRNEKIPVSTIASKVGYGNYSYFSKLFKDLTGCTPNEYRKKQKS